MGNPCYAPTEIRTLQDVADRLERLTDEMPTDLRLRDIARLKLDIEIAIRRADDSRRTTSRAGGADVAA